MPISQPHGARSPASSTALSDTASNADLGTANDQPVNMGALKLIASDIKDTLAAAIADLKLNLQTLCMRMDDLEETTTRHDAQIHQTLNTTSSHTIQLREMQRHLEDLDNRGRRHNLRVRGIPESIEPTQLPQTTSALFNDLLGRPPAVNIDFERIHRALRPRGRDTDPPRDVVCCFVSFRLKEDILRKARERREILLQGSEIKIFQDLSPITLQKRRDLRPLLDLLRTKDITYRWKFPFCLSASAQGHTALLRSPDDLRTFCETLNLPLVDLPDWSALIALLPSSGPLPWTQSLKEKSFAPEGVDHHHPEETHHLHTAWEEETAPQHRLPIASRVRKTPDKSAFQAYILSGKSPSQSNLKMLS